MSSRNESDLVDALRYNEIGEALRILREDPSLNILRGGIIWDAIIGEDEEIVSTLFEYYDNNVVQKCEDVAARHKAREKLKDIVVDTLQRNGRDCLNADILKVIDTRYPDDDREGDFSDIDTVSPSSMPSTPNPYDIPPAMEHDWGALLANRGLIGDTHNSGTLVDVH